MNQIRSKKLVCLLALAVVGCQTFSAPFEPPTQGLNSFHSHTSRTAVDGEAEMMYLLPQVTQSTTLKWEGLNQIQIFPGQRQGDWISSPQLLPPQAKSLLPAWKIPTPVGVQLQWQIRFSPDQQQWGAWMPLLKERPIFWPLSARYFQYQLEVQTTKSSTPPFQLTALSLQFGNRGPLASRPPRNRVAHPIAKPPVMPREGWNAAPPYEPYTPHVPDGIVVHHTWQPDQAHYRKEATIRGIQKYHMEERKWNDIGYHFLIGPEGVIYQGRPENVLGSHSVPNTGKIGICIIGDYDPGKDPFTPESYQALVDLMTWLTAEYQVSPQEFYGHRNFSTKSCPGDSVYNRLDEIRAEVKRRLEAVGMPLPTPPSPPAAPTPEPSPLPSVLR